MATHVLPPNPPGLTYVFMGVGDDQVDAFTPANNVYVPPGAGTGTTDSPLLTFTASKNYGRHYIVYPFIPPPDFPPSSLSDSELSAAITEIRVRATTYIWDNLKPLVDDGLTARFPGTDSSTSVAFGHWDGSFFWEVGQGLLIRAQPGDWPLGSSQGSVTQRGSTTITPTTSVHGQALRDVIDSGEFHAAFGLYHTANMGAEGPFTAYIGALTIEIDYTPVSVPTGQPYRYQGRQAFPADREGDFYIHTSSGGLILLDNSTGNDGYGNPWAMPVGTAIEMVNVNDQIVYVGTVASAGLDNVVMSATFPTASMSVGAWYFFRERPAPPAEATGLVYYSVTNPDIVSNLDQGTASIITPADTTMLMGSANVVDYNGLSFGDVIALGTPFDIVTESGVHASGITHDEFRGDLKYARFTTNVAPVPDETFFWITTGPVIPSGTGSLAASASLSGSGQDTGIRLATNVFTDVGSRNNNPPSGTFSWTSDAATQTSIWFQRSMTTPPRFDADGVSADAFFAALDNLGPMDLELEVEGGSTFTLTNARVSNAGGGLVSFDSVAQSHLPAGTRVRFTVVLRPYGTGSLSASASLSGSGRRVSRGSGSISATATLAGSGQAPVEIYSGEGHLAATASLSGTGQVVTPVFSGTGDLSATATLAGSGQAVAPVFSGTGALSATVVLTGSGRIPSITFSGTGQLDATAALSGQGRRISRGTGQLDATVALDGTGLTVRRGSGSLSAAVVLAGDGAAVAPVFSGTGHLTAVVTLVGLGNAVGGEGTGTGHLTAVASLTGSGRSIRRGAGALTASVVLLGDGSAVAPVFSGSGALVAASTLSGQGFTRRQGSGALTAFVALLGQGRNPLTVTAEIWNGTAWVGMDTYNGTDWVTAEVWNHVDGQWQPLGSA